VVAHYARAGEASPGVIRIDQLVEGVLVAPPRPCILRAQHDLAAFDALESRSAVAGWERAAIDDSSTLSVRRASRSLLARSNGNGRALRRLVGRSDHVDFMWRADRSTSASCGALTGVAERRAWRLAK
jgi:hypothetical protein